MESWPYIISTGTMIFVGLIIVNSTLSDIASTLREMRVDRLEERVEVLKLRLAELNDEEGEECGSQL